MLEMICIAFVNTLYYFCVKTKILNYGTVNIIYESG